MSGDSSRSLRGLALLFAAALLAGGCAHTEPAWRRSGLEPALVVAGAREVGVLPKPVGVGGRDGGYSAAFDGMSVWVFGDTVLTTVAMDGQQWRTSTWCATHDLDGSDGVTRTVEPLDAAGMPYEFLPFTADELAYNRANFFVPNPGGERTRWGLWPGPVVPLQDGRSAYVFYEKIFAGSGGQWDFHSVGHGIAVWRADATNPERPVVRHGAEHPTLLFPQGDAPMANGAFIEGGFLYAYGCDVKPLAWPMLLGRVPVDRALDRGAWRFYAGNGTWVEDWHRAVPTFEGAPMVGVFRSAELGCFVAVYSVPLENRIAARTAPSPEGPWSDPVDIATCEPPTDKKQWCYSGLPHPEFGGGGLLVSYYRETSPFRGEIRLVDVRLKRRDDVKREE